MGRISSTVNKFDPISTLYHVQAQGFKKRRRRSRRRGGEREHGSMTLFNFDEV